MSCLASQLTANSTGERIPRSRPMCVSPSIVYLRAVHGTTRGKGRSLCWPRPAVAGCRPVDGVAPEVEDVERERAPHCVLDPRLLGERLHRFHEKAAHRVGRQRRNQLRRTVLACVGRRACQVASRLSPNRSLRRLARTVKNIWTKSEMRRTSQPGSMMKCSAVLRGFGNPVASCQGGSGADVFKTLKSERRGVSSRGATAFIRGALLTATTQHAALRMRARGAQNAALVGCPLN